MNRGQTRPSLLLRVRDLQDQESWHEFVELYGPLILRVLLRRGVPWQDAVDLVNDVLLIVARRIRDFEYDPGKSFRAWLAQVTRHRAYRFFLQQARRPRAPGGTDHVMALQETPDTGDAENELIEAEWRRRRLELAIGKLRQEVTAEAWDIFESLVIQELSPAEVGRRLGMKPGAVYTAKCRILKRLRQAVEEIDE